MEILAIILISFIILLIFNVPIAVSMGLSTFIAILFSNITVPPVIMAQRMFASLDSFPFMAVPFFVLAGTLMEKSGMSNRLIEFSKIFAGKSPAALAIITLIASTFFGALTGSAAATVAAIGGIMIPAMKKDKYPDGFASATVAAGGTMGVILPPSVPMITYAVIANVSVGALFMTGFVPAAIMLIVMFVAAIYKTRKYKIETVIEERPPIFKAFLSALGALLMPIIILGGIYSGWFTATEAASVAVVYVFIVGVFIYKEIKFKDLPAIFVSSSKVTALILFLIGTAGAFSWLLTNEQIPAAVSYAILGITENPIILLALINIILLAIGTVIETNALILMVTPIFLPIITAIGYSPVAFGLIMIINTAVGKLIPPVALNIMVASSISKTPIAEVSKAALVYLIPMLLVVFIMTYLPELILFLPRLLGLY